MKRFAFRLQRLLELRARAERLEAAAMGAAMRVEDRQRRALAELEAAERRAAEQAAAQSSAGPATAGQRAHLDLARESLGRHAEQAGGDVADAAARTEEARAAWGLRRKDRRAVERLRERRLEAWREEGSREEQRTMDDLAQRPRASEES
jgi:flagellar export protein FliJ